MPELKHRLPPSCAFLPWLPTVVILAWWLYDLQELWRALPEYRFGWITLALAGYLVWDRRPLPLDRTAGCPQPAAVRNTPRSRRKLLPEPDRPVSLGLCVFLVLVAMPFVLFAELYKQAIANTPAATFALTIGCLLFLTANVLYLRGPATLRHFRLPTLFLLTAVPLPGLFWNPVVLGLQRLVTRLNVETLNLCGIPAVQEANVIQLPNGLVGIDEACSGVRSLQSCLMAALFIGAVALKRSSIRLALVVAGVSLALFGNYLRSVYLSSTAYRCGSDAVRGAHDLAGWTIFGFTTLGLLLLATVFAKWESRAVSLNHGITEVPKH
ncbi:MAG: exosortase [Verrucomicrobia bacterium]|nr:exosortase [Verrucomicrobiota bacterium]